MSRDGARDDWTTGKLAYTRQIMWRRSSDEPGVRPVGDGGGGPRSFGQPCGHPLLFLQEMMVPLLLHLLLMPLGQIFRSTALAEVA